MTEPPAPAPTGAARWCLHLLGVPCLRRADAADEIALSPKDAALLALVALDGPIPAERLALRVWPDADAPRAVSSLRQRLFRLRRRSGAVLVATGGPLRLDAGVQTDLETALARIATDPGAARAELLGDLRFDDAEDLAAWVQQARERWRERRDHALAAAAEACEAAADTGRALAYARRLAETQPLSESVQRRVIRLHYLRGDHVAAIAAFERFEAVLKDELGTRPSAETRELIEAAERAATQPPARRSGVPASLLRPPRVIGRRVELDAMADAWSDGHDFVLVGEAGIGKTRCLQELAAGADALLGAQARPGDAAIPYALLSRLLRAVLARDGAAPDENRRRELALLLPELGESLAVAGEAHKQVLLRAVEATLADATAQGLKAIVIDDLHFADAATLELLHSLRHAPSLALLRWGLAQRPGDGGHWHDEPDATPALRRIVLAPLDAAATADLLNSIALPEVDVEALAPALWRHTGGHPMFLLETLKHMVHDGTAARTGPLPRPAGVGALIEHRLGTLSPAALKLARAAALAGRDFSAELAAAVLEAHPLDIAEPWRELEAAQVLREGGFAHDLIFEATRDSVPAPIARLLQARIARELESRGAAPASVAPHWAGAGEWVPAGLAHAEAARQARAASQRGHEVDHWRAAEQCFERAGDRARSFEMRCESIEALILVHGVSHAGEVIDVLLRQAEGPAQRCAALTAHAMARLMAGEREQAVDAALQAGALARTLATPWPAFEAARLHAVGLAQGGRAVEGLALLAPFRELVQREGSPQHRGRYWSDLAYVLNMAHRLRETGDALAHAIENAQALGDLAELATLTSNLATVEGNLGHAAQARALAQRSLALQERLGTTAGPGGGVVEMYAALYGAMTGRYDEALARIEAALARFERDGQTLWIALARNHQAALLIDLGQHARARRALEYEPPPLLSIRARGHALAARIERALGRSGAPALRDAVAAVGEIPEAQPRMLLQLEEAETLAADLAATRCEAVQQQAAGLEYMGVAMKAGLLRAAALHRAGHGDAAASLLRELLPRLAGTQPADFYLPRAWWIAAQVFGSRGEVDDAAQALADGVRWIRQVALPHVPEAFRDSFLHRNEVNRSLLAAAGAGLG